jgi:hypothetical protein
MARLKTKRLGRPPGNLLPSTHVGSGGTVWMQATIAAKVLDVHRTRIYQLIDGKAWKTLTHKGLTWVRDRDVRLYAIHRRELQKILAS